MKAPSVKPVRCAVYTRVSTEHGLDQEFNSLDAQHDAASAYIKSQAHAGWTLIRSRYDDGGYSGGSTDRPDLQRQLDDIRARKIDVIVVHKVDHVSGRVTTVAALRARAMQRSASQYDHLGRLPRTHPCQTSRSLPPVASVSNGFAIRRLNGAGNLRRSDSIRNNCRSRRNVRPEQLERRARLVSAIAGGRRWLDDVVSGRVGQRSKRRWPKARNSPGSVSALPPSSR